MKFAFLKQDTRAIWLCILLFCAFLLAFAHLFLQEYLYMQPCEQCVYIRLAFVLILLGAFLALLNPKSNLLLSLAFVLCFWGLAYGLEHAFLLQKAYKAVATQSLFGGLTCKEIPSFAFNLALYEWFAGVFKPSGSCGLDYAMAPVDTNLSGVQRFFIGSAQDDFQGGIYSQGWYLLPWLKFLNMAEAAALCLVILAFVLGVLFLKFSFKKHYLSAVLILASTAFLVYFDEKMSLF